MRKLTVLSMAFASTVLLAGCGKKEEEKEEPKNAIDALQGLADKAKEMQNKAAVDPVDFRKLKELLPENLIGLSRSEASGEKTGAMGFTISTAKAEYSKEGADGTVRIEIVDTGGIAGVAGMALAAWSIADIDKETESGYEKTTKIDGHKAFEKYDNNDKSGELNVLVGDRFIVNIHVRGISSDDMRSIVKDLSLDKLEDL